MLHDPQIREAREGDFEFVAALMENALAAYYDGDHRAHAERIFRTHMSGGCDKVGHFSLQQCMFILTDGDQPLGMVNIVEKRQGTWKISPLIVTPESRGINGCGSRLLSFVERYAQDRGARQIYCTVAQQNRAAYQFFRSKGYIVAGRSEGHYKSSVTEAMLYKPFVDIARETALDSQHLSVRPFEEKYTDQVRALILERLAPCFYGVDDAWVDALYRGYDRRHTSDVNTKYKLIFVVVDQDDRVLGVVGATPKKGEPIKLMPCIAHTAQAFSAMLIELPHLLKPYGRKLYMHIVPSVAETTVLQRLGWSLDAVMPAAYHNLFCAQQWSNHLENEPMRMMRVKNRYFQEIMSGRKALEVRVAYTGLKGIAVGEQIRLMTQSAEGVVRIRGVRTYPTFEAMLAVELYDRIVPGTGSANEVLDILRGIYPPEKERLGVLVLELETMKQK